MQRHQQLAWEHRVFRQFSLHKLAYHGIKERFGLSAQVVVRCLAKVADAYKLDKKTRRTFKPLGSVAYDSRILSWKLEQSSVSIWTVEGRQTICFSSGERQRELLKTQQGESDLALMNGEWFLFATCNVDEPEPEDVEGVLGVDLGIVNIAGDSDGETHSGSHITSVRYRHRRLRTKLQRKGTKSAKRRLKKLSGKEKRFAQDVNHCVAKRIVARAERTKRAIALEELKGIRARVRARRQQRATLHSWAFADLQAKIAYKARQAGVVVVYIDPRNTSRECPCCGHTAKQNRTSQALFSCVNCGHSAPADYVAALNIRGRANVNWPNVGAF